MFENLTALAVFIMVLWLVIGGLIFYVSRQQSGISDDLEELRGLLDESEDASD